MAAYYNEIDPYAAEWLRNLIKAGHVAGGEVDERSIVNVQPDDLLGFEQCHFFAGIGIWSLSLRRAGWPDDKPVWTGSCPCQPFSVAGFGKGTEDERHVWPEFFRIIDKCRPPVVFGEQVAGLSGLEWFSGVHADMEAIGYAVGGAGLSSAGAGKLHTRARLYWGAANSRSIGGEGPIKGRGVSQIGQGRAHSAEDMRAIFERPFNKGPRLCEPLIRRGDHGYSPAVDRLRALGNAIDPDVASNFIPCFEQSVGQIEEFNR